MVEALPTIKHLLSKGYTTEDFMNADIEEVKQMLSMRDDPYELKFFRL